MTIAKKRKQARSAVEAALKATIRRSMESSALFCKGAELVRERVKEAYDYDTKNFNPSVSESLWKAADSKYKALVELLVTVPGFDEGTFLKMCELD